MIYKFTQQQQQKLFNVKFTQTLKLHSLHIKFTLKQNIKMTLALCLFEIKTDIKMTCALR